MTPEELKQEIESQRNNTITMTKEKYEMLVWLSKFGDDEGNNALEQLESFHAQEAQNLAYIQSIS